MTIQVDPDWWQKIFDAVYLVTDATSVDDAELTRREVELITELVPLRPGQRILDLCGGHGRHSLELACNQDHECLVLDYSPFLIDHGRKLAREKGLKVHFVQGDARATGLPAESFDHVFILGNSLGYLPDPSDDRRILLESFRVMKRGGWLLLDVMDGAKVRALVSPSAWYEIGDDIVVCREREMLENTVRARELVLSKKTGLIRDQTYAMRLYDSDSLPALVRDCGFQIQQVLADFAPQEGKSDYGFMTSRLILTAKK